MPVPTQVKKVMQSSGESSGKRARLGSALGILQRGRVVLAPFEKTRVDQATSVSPGWQKLHVIADNCQLLILTAPKAPAGLGQYAYLA